MSGAGSILVVDDDEANRDMLSRRLKKRGYQVDIARDGFAALEMVNNQKFDLILLDVMMPGLDGIGVLKVVRESRSPTELPVIMTTAKDKSEDVVSALSLGASDYVTKPLDFPVVLARIESQLSLKRAVDKIRVLEENLERRNRALMAANSRMLTDLKAAAKVQSAMLPRSLPALAGTTFSWDLRPCDELAGDGLGIVELDASHVGLYVLDVSGHGVASALLSVSVARVLGQPSDPASILAHPTTGLASPAAVAGQLNLLFPFDTATEQYFTFVYGVLDVKTGEFRYTSAGHPAPLHVAAAGGARLLDGRGFPIGLAEDDYDESSIQLKPGDRLYLYSDGVPEATSPTNVQFGTQRLLEAASRVRVKSLPESVLGLRADVEDWCGSAGVRDDVSILALEMAPEETPHGPANGANRAISGRPDRSKARKRKTDERRYRTQTDEMVWCHSPRLDCECPLFDVEYPAHCDERRVGCAHVRGPGNGG